MLCCIVLLAFFGFVLRRGGEDPFPPQARRTAGGEPVAVASSIDPAPAAAAGRVFAPQPRSLRRTAVALIAGGIAWTLAGIVDMQLFGTFSVNQGHSMDTPVIHVIGFAAVIAGSILLIVDESKRARPVGPRQAC